MKKYLAILFSLGLLLGLTAGVRADEEKADGEKAVKGSIAVDDKTNKTDLPALAKISFQKARKIASEKVKGSVIKGELEAEDGGLQYSFEIVDKDKVETEVEVDAGNGKILAVDVEKKDEGKEKDGKGEKDEKDEKDKD